MKYLKIATIILCVLFASNAFGQTRIDTTTKKVNVSRGDNKVDSINVQTTPLFTISDVNELLSLLAKSMSIEQTALYTQIQNFFTDRLQKRGAEYYDKQKQPIKR